MRPTTPTEERRRARIHNSILLSFDLSSSFRSVLIIIVTTGAAVAFVAEAFVVVDVAGSDSASVAEEAVAVALAVGGAADLVAVADTAAGEVFAASAAVDPEGVEEAAAAFVAEEAASDVVVACSLRSAVV